MSQLDLLFNERTGEVEIPTAKVLRKPRAKKPLAAMLDDLRVAGPNVANWRPEPGPATAPTETPVDTLQAALLDVGRHYGRAGVVHSSGVGESLLWCENAPTVEAAWSSNKPLRYEGRYCRSGHLVRVYDLVEPLEVLRAAGGVGSPAHRQLIRLGCLLLRCLPYQDSTWLGLLGETEAWTLGADIDAADLHRRTFAAEPANARGKGFGYNPAAGPWRLLCSLTTGAEGRYQWGLGSLVGDMLVFAPDTERTTETLRALIRVAVPPSMWLADVLALADRVRAEREADHG